MKQLQPESHKLQILSLVLSRKKGHLPKAAPCLQEGPCRVLVPELALCIFQVGVAPFLEGNLAWLCLLADFNNLGRHKSSLASPPQTGGSLVAIHDSQTSVSLISLLPSLRGPVPTQPEILTVSSSLSSRNHSGSKYKFTTRTCDFGMIWPPSSRMASVTT